MVRRGVALLLVVFLSLSIANQCKIDRDFKNSESVIPVKRHEVSYVTHAPFNITSNADFETQAWPGNGSLSDPYLIENLNITTNSSTCIWIMNTTSHFILQDCLITSPVWDYANFQSVFSITLTNVSNGKIRGNQIVNSTTGISGYALTNSSISDNRFNVTWMGIDVRMSNFTTIFNNTQKLDPCYYGISIGGCSNCTVYQNQFRNILSDGISAVYNHNTSFIENILIANEAEMSFPWSGIDIGGETCIVSRNEISNFYMSGISVSGNNHLLENNNITSSQVGILITANTSIARSNNLTGNFIGFLLVNANSTEVYDNRIYGNSGFSDVGIAIHGGYDCQIYSNEITHVGVGIYLQGATGFNISENTVTDGRYGFTFGWYSNWGEPEGPSFDCVIANNSFDGGGLYLQIEYLDSWDFDTIRFEDNTVNNRPIGFYAYLDDTVLDGDDYGQVFLVSCTDVILTEGDFYGISSDRNAGIYYDPGIASAITLLNCTGCEIGAVSFHNNTIGVKIQDSTDCLLLTTTGHYNSWAAIEILDSEVIVISAGYLTNNYKAITSDSSWDLRIFNCLIWENEEGIDLSNSPGCLLDYNEVFHNTDAIILENSDGCRIFDNSIYENSRGLLLNSTSDCLIMDNLIYNNTGVGISLDGTSHLNDIYQNTFENNLPNALCEGASNHWDNQVDIGNRWSDYSGEGPYIIDANDQDNFPMVDSPIVTPPTGIDPGPKFPEYLIAAGVLLGAMALVIIIVVVDRRRVIIID